MFPQPRPSLGLTLAPNATGMCRRPAVEYIRDVYAELVALGEGARRPGDRSDISSDEEDEMEVMHFGRCLSSMAC